MSVNWEEIYDGTIKVNYQPVSMIEVPSHFQPIDKVSEKGLNKKFDIPIKPLPWSQEFQENILLTLEWLVRDHRKDAIKFSDEMLHTHIKDFWYHKDFDPGFYSHVCFPKELMTWRTRYDSVYGELSALPPNCMSSKVIKLTSNCKNILWTMWKMYGVDGNFNEAGHIGYRYICSRCGVDMPKSVKMYTKLTQSKIKDL